MIRTEESDVAIVSTFRMIDRMTSLPARRAIDWRACMSGFRSLTVQGTVLGGASQTNLRYREVRETFVLGGCVSVRGALYFLHECRWKFPEALPRRTPANGG